MSPASSGNLEVERYVGACLISRKASAGKARNERMFVRQHPDLYHHQQQQQQQHYGLPVRCQTVDGWAGGMPLISFANHQRRSNHHQHQHQQQQHRHRRNDGVQDCAFETSPLARLAVHTQGAPLILAKSYNHRKNKVNRNNGIGQGTKVFENSSLKNHNVQKCQQEQHSGAGVDAISVTSDESSGSANNENCLPRIIKPRKRRKKDRKPPVLGRPLSQDGFSTDSASPDIDNAFSPFLPFSLDSYSSFGLTESPKLIDRYYILGDISETPKLHHSFDDIEDLEDDGKDINGNQSATVCQCRYCDPSGQIWDVDQNCYSPFLTPPNDAFQFPNVHLALSDSSSLSDMVHGMSSMSLEEDEASKKIPPSRSSSSSSCRDLEVSTEIVTSLNGHRDLEIKFYSSASLDNNSSKNTVRRTSKDKCDVVNSDEIRYVKEE